MITFPNVASVLSRVGFGRPESLDRLASRGEVLTAIARNGGSSEPAKNVPAELSAISDNLFPASEVYREKNPTGRINVEWHRIGWLPWHNSNQDERAYPLYLKIHGYAMSTTPIPTSGNFGEIEFIPNHDNSYYGRGVVCSISHDSVKDSIQTVVADGIATKNLGLKLYESGFVSTKDGPLCQFPLPIFVNSTTHYYRSGGYRSGQTGPFDYTFNTVYAMTRIWDMGDENLATLIKMMKAARLPAESDDDKLAASNGVAKTWAKIKPFIKAVQDENIMTYVVLRSFLMQASRTIDGVKLSTLFNGMFSGVSNKDDVIAALPCLNGKDLIACLKETTIWKERRKVAIKAKGNRAFTLLMQEYEYLKLDEKRFPVTTKTIKAGEIPIGTFFTKSEQYFLQNDNWPLWEEMLKKHKTVALEMAAEVSRRTTYEKDLMSYFYFLLHALPAYLKRHTGKKWTCIPRLVENQSELEPPTTEGGVARKRSALTPIVDNEACTVTVPYASLAIPGRQTTYCYGLDFMVLEEGLSMKGNVVMDEVEKRLNGRDDYGLMFYTLTGSAQGRGYPTFLIIFERRVMQVATPLGDYRNGVEQKYETFVHFHRTHPSRSKGGDYNGVHNWIKTTYNWMVGNVNAERIVQQQGDLIFVKTDKEVVFDKFTEAYDNHKFATPVNFAEYNGNENILGYVRMSSTTVLNHHEHMVVEIPAGTYEIRQCRSWEANPKGVWSLRID